MANGLPQGHYLIARSLEELYIRVVGLASMTNCVRLQEVLEEMHAQGCRRFIFDLDGCSGFDSTFMGLLLGIALKGGARNGNGSKEAKPAPAPGAPPLANGTTVVVVNSTAAHSKLLSDVGIDRVVRFHREPVRVPESMLLPLDDRPVEPLRRIRSMIAAHENLVRLGGGNVEKFGEMLDVLKRELQTEG